MHPAPPLWSRHWQQQYDSQPRVRQKRSHSMCHRHDQRNGIVGRPLLHGARFRSWPLPLIDRERLTRLPCAVLSSASPFSPEMLEMLLSTLRQGWYAAVLS